jgi:hypothetical protein
MPQVQIIASQTAAVTAKASVETGAYGTVTFSADNLAGAEEVDLFVNVGGTWKTLVDADGAAVTLTVNKTFATVEGGPTYAAVKDATAGACGVFVDLHPAD